MSSNEPATIDQPSTSGAGGPSTVQHVFASAAPNSSTATNFSSAPFQLLQSSTESYIHAPAPHHPLQQHQYYHPSSYAAQVPQRSPIPPPGDGHMPPQIIVPRPDQPQTIPQHSPAAQPPPHYPLPPHQMMPQQPQPMHSYPQGMGPPPGYWPPPQHHQQRYSYPGQDPSMQPPPMHMPSHGPPAPHYYLQVPGQHYAYGMPPKPMESYQNGPNNMLMQPPPVATSTHSQQTTSTAVDEDEAKRKLQQPLNMHLSPAAYPHQPQSVPPGMHRPIPPHMMPPHMGGQSGQIPAYVPTQYTHLLKPAQKEAVEKLVGVPSESVPPHTIPQRREFFEQLVLINDEQGEQLTAPPQVSKSSIDLHRLYIAVRRKGGFEQVTKEKSWKALCTEANHKMTESSAAGYQLRRHYQKYLLFLECRETGQNAEELKQFAEKLKKKKKEKDGAEGPSTPAQASSTAGPPTPNSIRSAATPTPQQLAQPQPSPSSYPNGPHHPAAPAHYPGMHGVYKKIITDQHQPFTPFTSSASTLSAPDQQRPSSSSHGSGYANFGFSTPNVAWARVPLSNGTSSSGFAMSNEQPSKPNYPGYFYQQPSEYNQQFGSAYPTTSTWALTSFSSSSGNSLKSPFSRTDFHSPVSNSPFSTTTMSKGRKRKNSDQMPGDVRKKQPTKRQAKQEKQQQLRPAYPSNYHQQPLQASSSDYLYPSQQNHYYDPQQHQPSTRNFIYAPTVSIPTANGPSSTPTLATTSASYVTPNQQSIPYLYPTPQIQYSVTYPPLSYHPTPSYFPGQPQQQYQPGFLAPPASASSCDSSRVSPRPRSQNSTSTRTNSPQIAALSPSQQPSVKIGQVQPPNYPYPYPATPSAYPPPMYPPQWSGSAAYGHPRFGPLPLGHPAYGAPVGADPSVYYYQQQQQNQHVAAMAQQQPMGASSGPMAPPSAAWPTAYPPAGYGHPQMRMPQTSATSYYPPQHPPHSQQPATSIEYQPQPPQAMPAPSVSSAQPSSQPNDRPSSSMSTSTAQPPQAASRPPSQAPSSHLPPPSTPENRQAGQEETRPASQQPSNVHRPGHTPTPTSSTSAVLGQPPPQAPAGLVQSSAQSYYGLPGGYPPRMPPPTGVPPSKSPYPQIGFPGMEPPSFIGAPHHSSHGMYPPPPAQHQPGMWPPPHHQPTQHPPMSQTQPPTQRYGIPGKPQHHSMPGQPPQGAQMPPPDFRRPQGPVGQPPAPYFPAASVQQMPSPGSIQRSRHGQQAIQASTSTHAHHHHSQRHVMQQQQQQLTGQFPAGTLESTALKLAMSRKKPRIFARDYAWALQDRRLMMSLRSGQELEFVWALNALTAMLYDDTQQPLRLDQMGTQLLNVLVEHLRATLAVLYTDIDFNINTTYATLEGAQDFGNLDINQEEPKKPLTNMQENKMDVDKRQVMPPVVVKNLPVRQSGSTSLVSNTQLSHNYTSRTRTDRQVKVEHVNKPDKLKRICVEKDKLEGDQKEIEPYLLRQQMELGRGSSFADRMYRNIQTRLNARRALSRPLCSLADRLKRNNASSKADKDIPSSAEDGYSSDRENSTEEQIDFYYRRAYSHEVWDRFAQPDCSLLSRPAPLNERDPMIQELVDRCVCLSNLIRGLAFVPINCRYMHSHRALLNICSKLLILCVKEDEQQRKARKNKSNGSTRNVKTESGTETESNNNDEAEEEAMEVDSDKKKSDSAAVDDPLNVDETGKFSAKQCEPEQDSNEKLLLETANQLRDDAFVILSQLSVHLDLYSIDSETSYPLLDALIHWAVTTNIQAQDPIHPGAISPRAYVFEIISKLSLLDKNIDLLLATGSWPRMEEFVRVVCNSITMSEELPLREFAIVILQAISVASEPVCIVATMQTQVIQNLISFLEIADQNMTAIASNDGLSALRDNTERIGTSIGMLRRAIQILYNFVQHEPCRPYFTRHQDKLLSFTVSSIMDSRVAVTAASILFDIQSLPEDSSKRRELMIEDYRGLAEQFQSCSWRLSDQKDESESQPASSVPTTKDMQSASKDLGFHPAATTPQLNFFEASMNGVDPVAINGNSKPKRKRLVQHSDASEMSALERELLRDSDAESIEGEEEDSEHKQSTASNNYAQHQYHHQPEPARKTVSESVKEKLHNHILKHEHAGDPDPDEPDAKRQRIVGNGVISPKCNGDLNNKARPATTNQQQTKAENGTPTPGNGSGSMTAVA